jgi:alanine racemase
MRRHTVARIDARALRENLARIRRLAGGSGVVSVVKADAYGHGLGLAVDALADSEVLAVATVGELEEVRQHGWDGRLLLLEGFADAEELQAVRDLRAECVLHRSGQLALLREFGGLPQGRAWLKIDTGMHRLGFPPRGIPELVNEIRGLVPAAPPVLMTHFACADEAGNPMTRRQAALLDRVTEGIEGPRSLANSAAILNFPETCRDLVRPGLMLYGVSPLEHHGGGDHGLRPVMTLQCSLLAINHCPAGDTVGYGARFRCPEDMRIGVAGIGYGDGYPRAVPDGTPVLLNGRRAKVAGRVSMDLLTIDLRGHEDAREGDRVTLWGEGLPVEEVARCAGLIPYELVCGVTGRVTREAV